MIANCTLQPFGPLVLPAPAPIPRAEAAYARGRAAFDCGRYAEAAAALREATSQDFRHVCAWACLSQAYLRLDCYADARDTLDAALHRNSGDPQLVRLAKACFMEMSSRHLVARAQG